MKSAIDVPSRTTSALHRYSFSVFFVVVFFTEKYLSNNQISFFRFLDNAVNYVDEVMDKRISAWINR